MASVVKKMECYNIRKSVKDLGEDQSRAGV